MNDVKDSTAMSERRIADTATKSGSAWTATGMVAGWRGTAVEAVIGALEIGTVAVEIEMGATLATGGGSVKVRRP